MFITHTVLSIATLGQAADPRDVAHEN